MYNSSTYGWHALSPKQISSYVLDNPAIYHVDHPQLFSQMSDETLSLLAPILAYWFYSLFFYLLDTSSWRALDKYRIHESSEVVSRNAVTIKEVIIAVIFQQVIQTILGMFLMNETANAGTSPLVDVNWVSWLVDRTLDIVLGRRVADQLLDQFGLQVVWWTYWWVIPTAQIIFGL